MPLRIFLLQKTQGACSVNVFFSTESFLEQNREIEKLDCFLRVQKQTSYYITSEILPVEYNLLLLLLHVFV